jgi:hypothetical protein|nr:MAG TPA: peptidase [Caudoviricetes sp.]
MNNFTEVKPLCYWVQHVLPLVYDDSLSYMELLARVTKRLNELIENNNKLPDYIMELIKEYISSGEIEKVLAEVLANYMLNVKFPPAGLTPATGDGSTDDTEAIQGCIDYAFNNGGMSVYFPSGSYLTQPLTLRNKATLFGQDRYTTRLVMKGGATTAMFTGDVDELTLSGLGFDGNMDIQVNNVNLFTISVNSAIISNCLLTDGYDLLNITVNNDLQLNNLLFRHAVENALVLKGNGLVQGENLIFKSVSTLIGKNFIVMDVSKSILEQVKCYGASPNGVLINGNNNVVKMWNEQSLTPFVDNGINNSVTVYTDSEVKKLTGSKTTIIGGNVTETITGNKGVTSHDITETANGDRTENTTGIRNETTGGNASESITGDKNVTAKNSIETLTENKTVNAVKSTESLTGDKTVTAANSIETIQGDKTITAGDISETAENKTVGINKIFHLSAEEVDFIVTNALTISSKDFVIDSTNPATYKQPLSLNRRYNYVPFKDINGDEYKVLVDNGFVSDYVNVKDYGAKGDGVTDDTLAIQSAINSLPNQGGVILFPIGEYIITDTITIGNGTKDSVSTKNCIALIGANNAATNLSVWAGNNGTCIRYKGTAAKPMLRILGPILDPVIENITLWGEDTASHGIYMTCGGQAKINKVTISSVTQIGLFIDVWNGLTVDGTANNIQCEFTNLFINVAFNPNAICIKTQAYGNKPNVDTNMCTFRNMFLLYNGTGGAALYLGFMDASLFQSIHCYKNGDTNGSHSIVFDGTELTGYPHELAFYNISPSTDGYDVKGTIGNIQFYELMVGDGAPVPNHPSISGFTSSRQIFGQYYFSNTILLQDVTPALMFVANNEAKQMRLLKNATGSADYGSVWEDTTAGQVTSLGLNNHQLRLDGVLIFDSNNPSGLTFNALALQNTWTGTLYYAKDAQNRLYIRGNLIPGNKNWGTIIAQLPADFRPTISCCLTGFNVDGEVINGIVIGTDGNIKIFKPADTNAFTTALEFNQIFTLS